MGPSQNDQGAVADRPTPAWPVDWSALASMAEQPFADLCTLHQAIDESVEPVIVELCRLRIAKLMGSQWHLGMRRVKAQAAGLGEDKIAALADWPTSPMFTEAERACLALAEQFCFGAFTVSDADVDAVLRHLSVNECYALVNGLWVFEAMQRMSIVMGVDPASEALGLHPAPTLANN
jgi:alkylhydroperoxidase family enzyme